MTRLSRRAGRLSQQRTTRVSPTTPRPPRGGRSSLVLRPARRGLARHPLRLRRLRTTHVPGPCRAAPPCRTLAGSSEELVLRRAGLATRATATKAWQMIAGALPAGTPARWRWSHGDVTLKFRAIRVKPLAIRGRGVTLSPFYWRKSLRSTARRASRRKTQSRGVRCR